MWVEFSDQLINLSHVTSVRKLLRDDYNFIELCLLGEKVASECFKSETDRDNRYLAFLELLVPPEVVSSL